MDLVEQIFSAGIVGAGGAGFPTHKKMVSGVDTLVVNAAECEPLLAGDRYVMRHYATEIIQGLQAIQARLNLSRVVIGTKSKYSRELSALRAAISAQEADIDIYETTSFYPAGDEQTLIYEVTGKTVPPGSIPLSLGIAVLNVTTVLNIRRAMDGIPVTHKYLTLTGEVGQPVVVEAPIGTSLTDCIAAAGGAQVAPFSIIRGGPMMGPRLTGEQLPSAHVGKQDGGVVVLPTNHPAITFGQKPISHMLNQAKSACIQCGYCTQYCPRYLIGHKLRPHRIMRSIAVGTESASLPEALLCCECGICELFACPMQLSPRRVNMMVKAELRSQGIKLSDTDIHQDQTEMRSYRKIAQSRLIHRLQLSDYPTTIDEYVLCQPKQVCIALKHGVGRPASPVVAAGDVVCKGDVIASLAFEDMGSIVHASIDGVVTAIDDQGITIVAQTELIQEEGAE